MAFDFPSAPVLNQVYAVGNASYLWNGSVWLGGAAAVSGGASPADYVLKAGDTMTGSLVLSADPTSPLQAATKQYVDAILAAGGIQGQALVKNAANVAAWGAPIDGQNY